MSEEEEIFRNLFLTHDKNGDRQLDRNEWNDLCSAMDIPDSQNESIFNILSKDENNITMDDFLNGFTSSINSQDLKRIRSKSRSSFGDIGVKRDSLSTLIQQCNANDIIDRILEIDRDADLPQGSTHITELYRILQYQYPHLVPTFKDILQEFILEIKYKESDLKTCEMKLENERKLNAQKMRDLEIELEAHLLILEEKARKEEQEKIRCEYEKKLQQNQKELEEIKERYNDLQKNHDEEEAISPKNETSEQMKERISQLQKENKELVSFVASLNENIELVRKEMSKMREEMLAKSEVENQTKELLSEYLKEHEKHSEQLKILSQQNTLLQDHNENLRIKLDSSNSLSTYSNHEFNDDCNPITYLKDSGDVMEEYKSPSRPGLSNSEIYRLGDGRSSEDAESVQSIELIANSQYMQDWKEVHEKLSGMNRDQKNVNHPDQSARCLKKIHPTAEQRWSMTEDIRDESMYDESFVRTDDRHQWSSWHVQNQSYGGTTSSLSTVDPVATIDTPERMYKVVLAGDSGVGKSSYMTQLCRKEFHSSMTTTLGVDFQTKTLDVDGKLYAIQLWDTAGQERFRSICKSYFRRADGVIVMYDCTNEKSFLNVRSWVDTIQNETNGDIPILLIANKTDLRQSRRALSLRVVEWVDGWRLADGEKFLFIETSAKENHNIEEAMIQLARALKTKEDFDVTNIRVGITSKPSKFMKNFFCCSKG